MKLPIPARVLEQHVITLGKTGSAKSSKLRVIVEAIIRDGKMPGCIVDKKGDWYGLKWAADGKKPGLDVVIFGGPHADVPISPAAGAEVGELVARSDRWCIIDMKGWMPSQCQKFFIAFAAVLYAKNQGKRFLLIDECHNFCPKGKILDVEAAKCLHWANTLAAEGRGLGITLLAASQRPAKVHNDFLTSCETLIACRVIHKADREAYADWIEGAGDRDAGKALLAEVSTMTREWAYVWSPEIGFGPKRIQWPMFETFDSFAPLVAMRGRTLKPWSPADLVKIREQLSRVIEEAQASDPIALRRQVVELREKLAQQKPAAPAKTINAKQNQIDAAFRRGMRAATATNNEDLQACLKRAQETILATMREIDTAAIKARASVVDSLKLVKMELRGAGVPACKDPGPDVPAPAPAPVVITAHVAPTAKPETRRAIDRMAQAAAAQLNGQPVLERAPRTLLGVIVQFPNGISKARLGLFAKYSAGSSTFDNGVGRLRSLGYATAGWPIQPTEEGLRALPDPDPLPTGHEARAAIVARFEKAPRSMLAFIFNKWPNSVTKGEISDATGYSPGSSTFDNALGALRSAEVVAPAGQPIKASDDLFT